MTVRRQFTAPGLANARFEALPQLAARLALRELALTGRRPLSALDRTRALRAALAARGDRLSRAAQHPTTETLLLRLCEELDDAGAEASGAVDRLMSLGGTPASVARLYAAYRAGCAGRLNGAAVLQVAAEVVRGVEAPPAPVVLFAPRRLSAAEVALLQALHERDRLHAVLTRPSDPVAEALLHGLLGPAT